MSRDWPCRVKITAYGTAESVPFQTNSTAPPSNGCSASVFKRSNVVTAILCEPVKLVYHSPVICGNDPMANFKAPNIVTNVENAMLCGEG